METNETGSQTLHYSDNLTQEKDPTPNFYAIIPAYVRYCKSIPHGAILLFGEITALCNMKGYCWACNSYFAKLYDVDISTIKRWIHGLVENQFIHIEIENGEKGSSRKIWIRDARGGGLKNEPLAQKRATPPSSLMHPPQLKNEPHNNTSNNTDISSKEDIEGVAPPEPPKRRKSFDSVKEEDKDRHTEVVWFKKGKYQELCKEYSKAKIDEYIKKITDHCLSIGKPNKYKDFAAAIRLWISNEGSKSQPFPKENKNRDWHRTKDKNGNLLGDYHDAPF